MAEQKSTPSAPSIPRGVNHLVINVRDIEESHKFYTEVVGLKQVGELKPHPDRKAQITMRFYAGINADGDANHHDLALVENKELPKPPDDWQMFNKHPTAINHIAFTLPDRETWLTHLKYLQEKEVPFGRRVNHGMTRSLYINDPDGYGVELLYELPREMWEGDIDAALNYLEVLPTEGPEALVDEVEKAPSF